MTALYPTDAVALARLDEQGWEELLTRLECIRVDAPRRLIRIAVSGEATTGFAPEIGSYKNGSLKERIMALHATGMAQRRIAEEVECHFSYVSLIIRGKR